MLNKPLPVPMQHNQHSGGPLEAGSGKGYGQQLTPTPPSAGADRKTQLVALMKALGKK
jgi:hypothetical protein